jgi:hypothetical protein
MSSKFLRLFIFFSVSLVFFESCLNNVENDPEEPGKISTVDNFDADIVLQWHKLLLEVNRFTPGYRPPAAARALGYIELAAYESVAPGMTGHQSVAFYFAGKGLQVPSLESNKAYHWPTVLNAVYYHSFKKFFPHVALVYSQRMEALEKRFQSIYGLKIESEIMKRSEQRGLDIADAFYRWSESDALGHYAFKNPQPADYTPPKGPGLWQPTPPDFGKALFPNWGKVRTFVLSKSELTGSPIQSYIAGGFNENPQSAFYQQAMEVYRMTTPLDLTRQWIGEFWSDDIYEQTFEPSARWVSVTNQLIETRNTDLETAVFLYAKLSMAMADAAIAIWNTKYIYNLERPVSFINRIIDASWRPTLDNTVNGLKGITPPFPAYPSGHAGFGAAAAGVLNSVYGKEVGMTDRSHQNRTEFNGLPRSFDNFDAMAEENALSRLYLGVHYRMDAEEGLRLGYLAAEKVNQIPWNK